jgi:hypothetical protein
MKPIKFPEANVEFATEQDEYLPLPAYRDESPQGQVISCWKLSFWDRVRILFIGRLWVSLMMFGKPLTPSYFTTKKSEVFLNPE